MTTGRICVLGHHEVDYPRNVLTQRLIRNAGWKIDLVHSRAFGPLRELALVRGYAGVMRRTDAVFLTEGSHRHVPWIKAEAVVAGKPVVFDAFTSRYNTRVEDRRQHAPGSAGAMHAWLQDWAAIRCSDHHVFDTREHRDYFRARYGTNGNDHVIEVGVDETVFRALSPPSPRDRSLRVLFYGSYIPLQGVEHIVSAAALLRDDRGIAVTLVGDGQTRPMIDAQLARARLENVTVHGTVKPEELVHLMERSHVCLGVFGDTLKAANVIPNKVVQAAAAGRPIVTRRSSAVARYFEDGASALLVDPADPGALAGALRALRDDPALCNRLAEGARAVFERYFSERALTEKMRAVLTEVTFDRR